MTDTASIAATTNVITQKADFVYSNLMNSANKLSAKETKYLSTLANHPLSSRDSLVASLATIKSAQKSSEVLPETLTGNSRVNEQELFAAIIHNSLARLTSNKRIARSFASQVQSFIQEKRVTESTEHLLLRAVRTTLRTMVASGQLPQIVARALRKTALGLAQLDDDRATLRTTRQSGSDETPLRSLRTALGRYNSNIPASGAEHQQFKEFVRREVRPESR